MSWLQDGDDFGVFARRYDASGVPQGPEFQVNTTGMGRQWPGSVTADDDGTFLIVWRSDEQLDANHRLLGRFIDSSGTLGPEFELPTDGIPEIALHYPPVASSAGAGRFVVAFEGRDVPNDADNPGVFVQRYGHEAPVEGRVLLLSDPAPAQRRLVVKLRHRSFSTQLGAGVNPVAHGAFLQLYNSNGSGESACLPLPASHWVAGGDPARPVYRYKDRSSVAGPCKVAGFKHGKMAKVVCRSDTQPIPFDLDEPQQGSLGVRLQIGEAVYCADFGGTIDPDVVGSFKAKSAAAPAECVAVAAPCP
jgi:hypothetical protein